MTKPQSGSIHVSPKGQIAHRQCRNFPAESQLPFFFLLASISATDTRSRQIQQSKGNATSHHLKSQGFPTGWRKARDYQGSAMAVVGAFVAVLTHSEKHLFRTNPPLQHSQPKYCSTEVISASWRTKTGYRLARKTESG